MYRSYLALGQYNVILGEVSEGVANVSLKAVRLLASFLSSPKGNKEAVFAQMNEMNKDPAMSSNTTLQLISAILYIHDDNVKDAMRSIYKTSTMEQHALLVQLYLRIDRLDLATKQHKAMKGIDEDSVLTAVAGAWVNLAAGGAKVQEASYTYGKLHFIKLRPSVCLSVCLSVQRLVHHLSLHHSPVAQPNSTQLLCLNTFFPSVYRRTDRQIRWLLSAVDGPRRVKDASWSLRGSRDRAAGVAE